MRENREFNSLPEIIEALSSAKYPDLTFVGKNYSKADLIRDLDKVDSSLTSQLSAIQSVMIKEAAFILMERFEIEESNPKCCDNLRLSAIRIAESAMSIKGD